MTMLGVSYLIVIAIASIVVSVILDGIDADFEDRDREEEW